MKNTRNYLSFTKKYGPGFVAISEKTGRVLAHGKDIKKMYEDAGRKNIDFTKVVISHVPKYGALSAYWRG